MTVRFITAKYGVTEMAKRNFQDRFAFWEVGQIQKAIDRTRWKITIDNDEDMYTCPKCESRMVAESYDRAVGLEGYNFCPYCGTDMRKPTQMTWEDIRKETNENN